VYSNLPMIGYTLKETYRQHDEPWFRFLSQIREIVNSSPYGSTQWEKASDLAFGSNKIKLFEGLGLKIADIAEEALVGVVTDIRL
jgi:hypothetical protein